ncbi:MAG: hypothetical protein WCE30_03500 [Mycobacterium sp.]
MADDAFLITGANAGLGKDAARQLALFDDVGTIFLACRNEIKARAAQADLQRSTGRPTALRVFMQHVMPRLGPIFGISHPLEVGTKRLVDGLVDASLGSGKFYASAHNTISGPLVDQSTIVADFDDHTVQDHAYAAIHAFLDPRP